MCDACLSALEVVTTMCYTNRRILYFCSADISTKAACHADINASARHVPRRFKHRDVDVHFVEGLRTTACFRQFRRLMRYHQTCDLIKLCASNYTEQPA